MAYKILIVVEGRDDVTAVKRALDCELITTGGFGFPKGVMEIRLKIYAFHVMEEEMQYLGLRYMNIKIKNIVCLTYIIKC